MTIVEFYDKISIENIVGALIHAPEKVILIGYNRSVMKKSICLYQDIASNRGMSTVFEFRSVNYNDLDGITKILSEIAEQNSECMFDLNGGAELFLVAVGMVAQKYGDRIKLHRFNIRDGRFSDCGSAGNSLSEKSIKISIDENIKIYGGKVIYSDEKADGTVRWDFSGDFTSDIKKIWEVCRVNTKQWNNQINMMDRLAKLSYTDEALEVRVNRKKAEELLSKSNEQFTYIPGIFKSLNRIGVILDLKVSNKEFSFKYKNEQIKRCLTKAGLAFELYVTVKMAEAENENGEKIYNDVKNGVYIDWDGKIQSRDNADVENEIDVMAMKGAVPIFISCKNGFFDANELYKLSTVANRFGNKYAKKVLAVSNLDRLGSREQYIRARAADMHIKIIGNIDRMSDEEFGNQLAALWKN